MRWTWLSSVDAGNIIQGMSNGLLDRFLRRLSFFTRLLRVMPRIQSRLGNNTIRLVTNWAANSRCRFRTSSGE